MRGATWRPTQQLGRTLRIFVNKLGRAWSKCLTEAAFAVNAADLSFAPFSPFYLMHGFQPRIKADIKCLADKDDKTLLGWPRDPARPPLPLSLRNRSKACCSSSGLPWRFAIP